MSYLIAGLSLIVIAWFIRDGMNHMKQARAEEARIAAAKQRGEKGYADEQLHPSLAGLALLAPAITTFTTFALAGGLLIAWLAVGRGTWFTVVDLACALGAFAAYAWWVNARVRLRQVQLDPAARR
jgi:hypothetical protein